VSFEFVAGDIDRDVAEELLVHPGIFCLSFRDCRIREGVYPLLARLSRLNHLEVTRTTIDSNEEFQNFLGDVALDNLYLNHIKLTPAHLEGLDNSRLIWASFQHCEGLTHRGVALLAESPNLKTLIARGVRLTQSECQQIASKRPDLKFFVDPADIAELQHLADSGMQLELNRKAQVVGLSLKFSEVPIEPGTFDQLSHLTRLKLVGMEIGNELLESIGRIKGLKSLSLEESLVASEGLAYLRGLSKLYDLNLNGIVNVGMGELKLPALPNLRLLQACSKAVLDGLPETPDLASLEHISLGAGATSAVLGRLIGLNRLSSIALNGVTIDNSMTVALTKISPLAHLIFLDCAIDERSLSNLSHVKRLARIHFIRGEVSMESLSELRQSAPALHIENWPFVPNTW
jgi:hypothetical protein